MMKKRLLTALFAVIMMVATYPVYASPDMHRMGAGIGIDQEFMIPDYSAVPDDYDEYGNPIFYVMVHPDIWAETFIYHPFHQGLTPYKDASFILRYIDSYRMEQRADWCARCGHRIGNLESRWAAVASRARNCPAFTVVGQTSAFMDSLEASTWEQRLFCSACGWASHHWNENWAFDRNERNWTWIIQCTNGTLRVMNVIMGASVRFGQHSPHQAVSIRFDWVVHGHNCSMLECTTGAC